MCAAPPRIRSHSARGVRRYPPIQAPLPAALCPPPPPSYTSWPVGGQSGERIRPPSGGRYVSAGAAGSLSREPTRSLSFPFSLRGFPAQSSCSSPEERNVSPSRLWLGKKRPAAAAPGTSPSDPLRSGSLSLCTPLLESWAASRAVADGLCTHRRTWCSKRPGRTRYRAPPTASSALSGTRSASTRGSSGAGTWAPAFQVSRSSSGLT